MGEIFKEKEQFVTKIPLKTKYIEKFVEAWQRSSEILSKIFMEFIDSQKLLAKESKQLLDFLDSKEDQFYYDSNEDILVFNKKEDEESFVYYNKQINETSNKILLYGEKFENQIKDLKNVLSS
jgi:hypothetical protein